MGGTNTGDVGGAGIGGARGNCPTHLSPESCNGVDDDCDGTVDNLGSFTCGLGACRTTVAACVDGVVQACVPLAPSTGPDGCDGIDNDCDGAVDEDCAECLHVALDGDDASATASGGTATFLTVQAAIDFAAGHANAPPRVCVAPGSACGVTGMFAGPTGTDLEMADGIDVLGGYESTGWTRCTNSTTQLAPTTGRGVVFPPSVQTQTVVDGFYVVRPDLSGVVAGITVDGARGAVIANMQVTAGASGASTSYGVDLKNGGDGAIVRSAIDAGYGESSVAVRAIGARVDVEEDCPWNPTSTEHCAGAPTTWFGGYGPEISGADPSLRTSTSAIELDDAPGSRIERSIIYVGGLINDEATIRVTGDATGVLIRGNTVSAGQGWTAENAVLRLEDCAGASPWIVDNDDLALNTLGAPLSYEPHTGTTVRAAGDCHPVIERNREIRNAPQFDASVVIQCMTANGIASRCVVTENTWVAAWYSRRSPGSASSSGSAVAVDCNFGCSRVDHNQLIGISESSYPSTCTYDGCGRDAIGLRLNGGSTWAHSNSIRGADLGFARAIGVSMDDPGGLLENNVIAGASAQYGRVGSRDLGPDVYTNLPRYGVGLLITSGVVSSNFIAGADGPLSLGTDGLPTKQPVRSCASDGVDLSGGTFVNNIITGGVCGLSIRRMSTTAMPASFAHNALYNGAIVVSDDDAVASGALLADAASTTPGGMVTSGTLQFTAGDVDATLDGTGSFAEQCAQSSDHHLLAGSVCIDAGALDGAPAVDFEGDARDAAPDVGPDEFR